jgi:hypothetical protein
MLHLLFLLRIQFRSAALVKPKQSRPANSEKYLVLQDRLLSCLEGASTRVVQHIWNAGHSNSEEESTFRLLSSKFVQQQLTDYVAFKTWLQKSNAHFAFHQTWQIEQMLKFNRYAQEQKTNVRRVTTVFKTYLPLSPLEPGKIDEKTLSGPLTHEEFRRETLREWFFSGTLPVPEILHEFAQPERLRRLSRLGGEYLIPHLSRWPPILQDQDTIEWLLLHNIISSWSLKPFGQKVAVPSSATIGTVIKQLKQDYKESLNENAEVAYIFPTDSPLTPCLVLSTDHASRQKGYGRQLIYRTLTNEWTILNETQGINMLMQQQEKEKQRPLASQKEERFLKERHRNQLWSMQWKLPLDTVLRGLFNVVSRQLFVLDADSLPGLPYIHMQFDTDSRTQMCQTFSKTCLSREQDALHRGFDVQVIPSFHKSKWNQTRVSPNSVIVFLIERQWVAYSTIVKE